MADWGRIHRLNLMITLRCSGRCNCEDICSYFCDAQDANWDAKDAAAVGDYDRRDALYQDKCDAVSEKLLFCPGGTDIWVDDPGSDGEPLLSVRDSGSKCRLHVPLDSLRDAALTAVVEEFRWALEEYDREEEGELLYEIDRAEEEIEYVDEPVVPYEETDVDLALEFEDGETERRWVDVMRKPNRRRHVWRRLGENAYGPGSGESERRRFPRGEQAVERASKTGRKKLQQVRRANRPDESMEEDDDGSLR